MRAGAVFLTAAALALLAAQIAAQPAPKKIIAMERAETKTDGKLKVASPAFKEGQTIPDRYVQAGENRSPALKWSGAPAETKSFVLILEDPDAPRPQPFLHWTLYNIPATTAALPEGIPAKRNWTNLRGRFRGVTARGASVMPGRAHPRGIRHIVIFFKFSRWISPLGLTPGWTWPDCSRRCRAMSSPKARRWERFRPSKDFVRIAGSAPGKNEKDSITSTSTSTNFLRAPHSALHIF